ncbi:MAG: cysteine desulfurase [Alphaproteobacteria bacterium]|nr:cysteine desulfurase [Alphaproteobacteria bacterium]
MKAAIKPVDRRHFDVARVREDFPILATRVNGKPLVYLDNAASAQKPKAVIDAMTELMSTSYANVHRGMHALSTAATEAYEDAREKVRAFLNAPAADQIIFTAGGTDSINLVANALGASIAPGDEIVLSEMEHHSNIVPWHFLRERRGAVIRWAPIKDDGALDLEAFERLLSSKTKLVALTHMSNVLGTVTPAKDIVRLAHARGVPVLFDGCQATVHMPVDVQDLGCDFYVATGHKLYGPTGIGVLYMTKEWTERLPPYRGGGEMIDEVHKDRVTYGRSPQRFEAGTPPIIEAVGLGAAIDYVNAFDRDELIRQEHDLLTYATERMKGLNWIRIQGTASGKGAIISFTMEGAHAHDVATLIDRHGVAVRAGHHCAQPLMERLGVTATARASFAFYNTRTEVDAMIDALHKARAIFA